MNENVLATLLVVCLFALPFIYHSIKFRGARETLYLLLHIVGIAVIVELIGVTSGAYIYTGQTLVIVTIFVGIGWIANTYPAFHFSLYILDLYQNSDRLNVRTAFLTATVSGLFGVTYDLFIDPVAVALNIWEWSSTGPWFGVPIANFIGWFFIIFSIILGYLMVLLFARETNYMRLVWSILAVAFGSCLVYLSMVVAHVVGV